MASCARLPVVLPSLDAAQRWDRWNLRGVGNVLGSHLEAVGIRIALGTPGRLAGAPAVQALLALQHIPDPRNR